MTIMSSDAQDIISDLRLKTETRDVGQTEIKSIPTDILYSYLSIVLCLHSFKYPFNNPEKNWLILSLKRQEDFPWYGIVKSIYMIGKLPGLIAHYAKLCGGGTPSCYYDISSACRYLGRVSPLIRGYTESKQRIVILSNYVLPDVINKIVLMLRSTVLDVMRRDFFSLLKIIRKKQYFNQYDTNVKELVIKMVILATHAANVEEIITEQAEEILSSHVSEIKGLLLSEYNVMGFFDGISRFESEEAESYVGEDAYVFDILYNSLNVSPIDLAEIEENEVIQHHESLINRYEQKAIRIVYTTLSDCIFTVRSHRHSSRPSSPSSLSDEVFQIPKRPDSYNPKFGKLCKEIKIRQYVRPYDSRIEIPANTFYLLSNPNVTNYFRVLGGISGSECNLIDILNCIWNGNVKINTDYLCIACLCDGRGGFLNVLSNLFPNAQYIFHTIPEKEYDDSPPADILHKIDDIKIRYEFLHEGYYMLDTNSLFDRIARYQYKYYIITCDLDYRHDDNLTYLLDSYININKFVYENLTMNGIFIIKVNLIHYKPLCFLLQYLSLYMEKLYLYQPQSISKSYYAYVISLNRTHDQTIHISMDTTMHPSNHIQAQLSKYISTLYRMYININNLFNHTGFDLYSGTVSLYSLTWVRYLDIGHRFVGLFDAHLGWNITNDEEISNNNISVGYWPKILHQIASIRDYETFRKSVDIPIDIYKQQLLIELKYDEYTYDDRAARRAYLLMKMFIIEGFECLMDQYTGIFTTQITVSRTLLNHRFSELYNSLEHRDKFGDLDKIDAINTYLARPEMECHYGKGFKMGLALAECLLGTLKLCSGLHEYQKYKIEDTTI